MTTTQQRVRFLRLIALFITRANLGGINLVCTSFYRSAAEQQKLFAENKSKCDGVKKRSRHQSWRAMDFVIIDNNGEPIWTHDARYDILGEIWESLGGTWGGAWAFKDVFHFEV